MVRIGLSAFLIGHLFYMSSFFLRWRFSLLRALTIIPLGLYGILMGHTLVGSLLEQNNDGLVIPVLIYICVILVMMWSAIMTGNKLAIIGSLLFSVSDSILAWNMFISDVAMSGLLIMLTYYSAQFCIARTAAESTFSMAEESTHRLTSSPN